MHVNNSPLLKRITINPDIMAGRPTIKGTRLTVEYILNLLGHGSTSGASHLRRILVGVAPLCRTASRQTEATTGGLPLTSRFNR